MKKVCLFLYRTFNLKKNHVCISECVCVCMFVGIPLILIARVYQLCVSRLLVMIVKLRPRRHHRLHAALRLGSLRIFEKRFKKDGNSPAGRRKETFIFSKLRYYCAGLLTIVQTRTKSLSRQQSSSDGPQLFYIKDAVRFFFCTTRSLANKKIRRGKIQFVKLK